MSDSETGIVSTKEAKKQEARKQVSPRGRKPAGRSNLDMINLSSQLTGMELLTKRRAKKRVRFSLPESDIRPASSQDFATFMTQKKKKLSKVPTLKSCQCQPLDKNMIREELSGPRSRNLQVDDKACQTELYKDTGDDDHCIEAKKLKSDNTELEDGNNNCSSSIRQYLRRKMLRARKSIKQKKKGNDKYNKNFSFCKKLVSKHKANLLKRAKEKATLKRKRRLEYRTSKCSKVKKAKISDVRGSARRHTSTKSPKRARPKDDRNSKGRRKSSSLVHKLSRVRTNRTNRLTKSAKRRPKVSAKVKRKVLLAKSLKRKALERKYALKKRQKELAAKRMAKKKAALKKKLAAKRKKLRGKSKMSTKKNVTRECKKPRKPKFIPLIREEDVASSMRVNLLIYRTFQRADEDHLHCCSRKCWKDWEDLDAEDVYIDYE